jgi:hypothetical protein
MRKTLLALCALATLLAASEASAWGRARVGVGVYVGGPYWGPYWGPAYYYPPPYYYYPPAAPAQPTEYIERIDSAERGWWYYCEQSRGYYPYVKECAGAWQRVAPVPPAPTPAASSIPPPPSPTSAPFQPPAPVPPAAPIPPAAPVPPMGPS